MSILFESPLKTLKQDLWLHRLSHEVALERLQESDVADYVAAAFAPGDLSAGLRQRSSTGDSDGNPLFMTAMLDHLVQRSVLVAGERTLAHGRDASRRSNPGVPETLRQMLDMQLQHASDDRTAAPQVRERGRQALHRLGGRDDDGERGVRFRRAV